MKITDKVTNNDQGSGNSVVIPSWGLSVRLQNRTTATGLTKSGMASVNLLEKNAQLSYKSSFEDVVVVTITNKTITENKDFTVILYYKQADGSWGEPKAILPIHRQAIESRDEIVEVIGALVEDKTLSNEQFFSDVKGTTEYTRKFQSIDIGSRKIDIISSQGNTIGSSTINVDSNNINSFRKYFLPCDYVDFYYNKNSSDNTKINRIRKFYRVPLKIKNIKQYIDEQHLRPNADLCGWNLVRDKASGAPDIGIDDSTSFFTDEVYGEGSHIFSCYAAYQKYVKYFFAGYPGLSNTVNVYVNNSVANFKLSDGVNVQMIQKMIDSDITGWALNSSTLLKAYNTNEIIDMNTIEAKELTLYGILEKRTLFIYVKQNIDGVYRYIKCYLYAPDNTNYWKKATKLFVKQDNNSYKSIG